MKKRTFGKAVFLAMIAAFILPIIALAKTVPLQPYLTSHNDWYKYQLEPYTKWVEAGKAGTNNNCGPAANAMVLHYFLNLRLSTAYGSSPAEAQQLGCYTEARWKFCEVNGFIGGYETKDSDPTGNDRMIAVLEHYGLATKVLAGSAEVTLERIRQEIDRGNLVICHVDAGKYKTNGYYTHWTIAFGYDDSNIIIHDPGYINLKSYSVPNNTFKSALENANGGGDMVLIVVSRTHSFDNPIVEWDFKNPATNFFDPQGWTCGYDTAPYYHPVDKTTFGVHVIGPNPGVVSPVLSAGIMAEDTIIMFSARVVGNEQPVKAEMYIMHKDGNWANRVNIGDIPVSDQYQVFMVNLSLVECFDPDSLVTPDILEVKRFSLELSQSGNSSDEYWTIDWVKVLRRDENLVYAIAGGGSDPATPDTTSPSNAGCCNIFLGYTPEGFTWLQNIGNCKRFWNNLADYETAMSYVAAGQNPRDIIYDLNSGNYYLSVEAVPVLNQSGLITILADNFSNGAIDLAKWRVVNNGCLTNSIFLFNIKAGILN